MSLYDVFLRLRMNLCDMYISLVLKTGIKIKKKYMKAEV